MPGRVSSRCIEFSGLQSYTVSRWVRQIVCIASVAEISQSKSHKKYMNNVLLKKRYFPFLRDKQHEEGMSYYSMWLNFWLDVGKQMAVASCVFFSIS